MLTQVLLVFLGGGVGSAARYGASLLLPSQGFPVATLAVNIAGCLAAGVALARLVPLHPADHPARLLLVAGFLGGLTTFSAFGLETVALLRDGRAGLAMLNVAANVGAGVLATWVGWLAARTPLGA
jgi:CrcB protein